MDWFAVLLWVVFFAAIIYLVSIYNQLVSLKNRYKNAFAQIEVQLKRRYDLIPNLVEVAKNYMQHERDTLEAVTRMRAQAADSLRTVAAQPGEQEAMRQLAMSETALSGALSKLNIAVEAYPELKADATMRQLSEELGSTENRVAFARQAYNDAVMHYNSYRQSFPQVIVSGSFGHPRDAALLEFKDSEAIQQAPQVSF